MRRLLILDEVETALNRGKTVEIFLGRISEDKEILSWLSLERSEGSIVVTQVDVYDEGSSDFVDVYAFSYVDPDMEFPEFEFDELSEAVEFIEEKYKLKELRFVNSGIIQDEYKDLLKKEGRI